MAITGPRIEILIDRKGGTTTSVHGVTGASCHEVSAGYEALFGSLISTEATTEAYEKGEEVEIKSHAG